MSARRVLAHVERFAPARALLRRRYERRFHTPHGAGSLCGVYASFADAARATPASAPLGYDHGAPAALYRDRLARIAAKDYPALFWLREALPEARTVFDLGGHVGVSFYGYRRYLDYPPGLRWVVCDVPAVAREGEALAQARGEASIAFTSDPREATGVDVLLASGALQYIEQPLHDLLAALPTPPRHVVVNQTPTHPGREFFTVQHIGVAYCPYRVAAEDAIPAGLAPLGYTLVDQWNDPSRRTAVPYETGASEIAYTGYYLRRERSRP